MEFEGLNTYLYNVQSDSQVSQPELESENPTFDDEPLDLHIGELSEDEDEVEKFKEESPDEGSMQAEDQEPSLDIAQVNESQSFLAETLREIVQLQRLESTPSSHNSPSTAAVRSTPAPNIPSTVTANRESNDVVVVPSTSRSIAATSTPKTSAGLTTPKNLTANHTPNTTSANSTPLRLISNLVVNGCSTATPTPVKLATVRTAPSTNKKVMPKVKETKTMKPAKRRSKRNVKSLYKWPTEINEVQGSPVELDHPCPAILDHDYAIACNGNDNDTPTKELQHPVTDAQDISVPLPDIICDIENISNEVEVSDSACEDHLISNDAKRSATDKIQNVSKAQKLSDVVHDEEDNSNESSVPELIECHSDVSVAVSLDNTKRPATEKIENDAKTRKLSDVEDNSNDVVIIEDSSVTSSNILKVPPIELLTQKKSIATLLNEISLDTHINLEWQGVMEKFYMSYHTKFADVINQIAEREHCKPGSIVLMLDDNVIQRQDTPETIRYHISKVITGRIVPGLDINENSMKFINKDMLKIKVLIEGQKRPTKLYIDKTQKCASLFSQCAQILNTDTENLKIKFDGDLINPDLTPDELSIESGDMLECSIRS